MTPLWIRLSHLTSTYLVIFILNMEVLLKFVAKIMHLPWSHLTQFAPPYQYPGHLGCSVLLSVAAGTCAGKSRGAAGTGISYCCLSGRRALFHLKYSATWFSFSAILIRGIKKIRVFPYLKTILETIMNKLRRYFYFTLLGMHIHWPLSNIEKYNPVLLEIQKTNEINIVCHY